MSAEERKDYARVHAGVESLENRKPRVAHDPVLRGWWGRARRLATSPGQALTWFEVAARIDVEQVLPTVRTPRRCWAGAITPWSVSVRVARHEHPHSKRPLFGIL